MTSSEIRQTFLSFFEAKGHKIVGSAPIVLKDDPTLMFTNAGMNQFKDFFLGNKKSPNPRIVDTQKCLRVSGKHNDLEEVGVDTYHHTMFEMLGNWSFGDYFKVEAIAWSWELLVDVFNIPKDRLYVTIFEGDAKENLPRDTEAYDEWKKVIAEDRILLGNKKDNFWEMGDTGPCGPCTEIHVDCRPDAERNQVDGKTLVNNDHPQVIEIWNNVFIQFNRKADGSLESLPDKHVDTGMGFERLVRVLQGKNSNYDSDVFTNTIAKTSAIVGMEYGFSDSRKDIAFRVLADHIRAISFTIADGQLPSNTGAGYVIRRILRRAVRYYFTFLNYKQPLLAQLLPVIADQFANVFPELKQQEDFVKKVIFEEEANFLKTLDNGLKRLDDIFHTNTNTVIDGQLAFELYDTYGFPIDLTRLIASENNWSVDDEGFNKALLEQKERSRADAKKETGDWITVNEGQAVEFVGYDSLEVKGAKILRHRTLKQKDETLVQLVLSKTPFYPEGGGQVGDTGTIQVGKESIAILDTKKENDLIIHIVRKLPLELTADVHCQVDESKRRNTENNHSATHLLHAALRSVLGNHVQQKGSLVKDDYLRFDFAHFQKMSDEEIAAVEQMVNTKIREDIHLIENRSMPIEQAKEAGAMMLFGEKYGDNVRMITFDPAYSRELCGGCHVSSTGKIGLLKIISESAIAAGVRRIEAVTASGAEQYINDHLKELTAIKAIFKNPVNTTKSVLDLQEENKLLRKEIEKLQAAQVNQMQGDLVKNAVEINGHQVVKARLDHVDGKAAKTLAYNILAELKEGVVVFGINEGEKCQLMVAISESLAGKGQLHAGNMVKSLAKYIDGGGGGQPFFASAGGKNPSGLAEALHQVDQFFS